MELSLFEKRSDYEWEIPRQGAMRSSGRTAAGPVITAVSPSAACSNASDLVAPSPRTPISAPCS